MRANEIVSWIFAIILLGNVNPNTGAWLKCYKRTLQNYTIAPLDDPTLVMSSPCIDPAVPTVVYTFGYRGRSSGPATTAVLSAYLATRKRNVILLDWEEQAKSGLLGISLGYVLSAVPNSKKVGDDLGEALVKLARAGLNMTHVHLIGHSLGAHVMGYAGRRARENGYIVPRITGLDPARALFEGSLAVKYGLDRTSARFVDIIHSDPGSYGTANAAGTVDIWPNYGQAVQPGCPLGNFDTFSAEDLCSHDRSWRYLVEAIGSATSLPATGAPSYGDWVTRPDPTNMIYLGDLTSTRASGNYYLTTNSHVPYGRGLEGIKPDSKQFRRRRRRNSITRLFKYFK